LDGNGVHLHEEGRSDDVRQEKMKKREKKKKKLFYKEINPGLSSGDDHGVDIASVVNEPLLSPSTGGLLLFLRLNLGGLVSDFSGTSKGSVDFTL